MRAIIILGCLLLASAGPVPDDKCFSFNGQYYDKEVLKADIDLADDFSYLPSKNTIYFSYTLPESERRGDVFTTAYLNLDTKEFRKISGVQSGCTTAVDPDNDVVYVAGDDGVYKYNPANDSIEFVAGKGKNIWSLYFIENIFYITFPEFSLYDSEDDPVHSDPKITASRIGGNADMYFVTNSSGLFRYPSYLEEKSELYAAPVEYFDYKGFAIDASGKVFVFGVYGVYLPDIEKKTLDKVASFDYLNGLVFVKDGIVYSTESSIVKLTPSKVKCPEGA